MKKTHNPAEKPTQNVEGLVPTKAELHQRLFGEAEKGTGTAWDAPKAEDMVIQGDENHFNRLADIKKYKELKDLRRGFDKEEKKAEIAELHAMFRAPSVVHPGTKEYPGSETRKDQEIDGIWASWSARMPEQQVTETRARRWRRIGKVAFKFRK